MTSVIYAGLGFDGDAYEGHPGTCYNDWWKFDLKPSPGHPSVLCPPQEDLIAVAFHPQWKILYSRWQNRGWKNIK